MSTKTRLAVAELKVQLNAHSNQDTENFTKMDKKLDTLLEKVVVLDTLHDVSSRASRNTALKWSAPVAAVLPILVIVALNACGIKVPYSAVAPVAASVAAPIPVPANVP